MTDKILVPDKRTAAAVQERLVDYRGHDYLDGGFYTFINPHTYLIHRLHDTNLECFDGIFVDSALLVRILRLLGCADIRRTSFDFSSIAGPVLSQAAQNRVPSYLAGTTDQFVAQAARSLVDRYAELRLVGWQDGYFDWESELSERVDIVMESGAELVIVGMGAPRQELFLTALQKRGFSGTAYTCGGFLHQVAQHGEYYPRILDAIECRWLYRAVKEPHVRRRLLVSYPRATVAILVDMLALDEE